MNDTSYNLFGVTVKPEWRNGVVAIGNFDGVHCGHQALLQRARAIADQEQIPLIVLTFAPHPRVYFQPQAEPFLITQPEHKESLLKTYGADGVITLPFNERFSRLSAADFIQDVLTDGLAAKHIVIGQNFVFGHGRQGHVETLLAHGFDVTALSPVTDATGMIYSSTAVRQALLEGRMTDVAVLLDRGWGITGRVVKGRTLGRELGFPTANIIWPPDIIHPLHGIYAITCTLPDGHVVKGVGYYGVRPTVTYFATAPLLEVHLFDFDNDLYGNILTITFGCFIRPDQKFETLEDLQAQIARDCQIARDAA